VKLYEAQQRPEEAAKYRASVTNPRYSRKLGASCRVRAGFLVFRATQVPDKWGFLSESAKSLTRKS
jgi:hypothetical protein